MARETYLETVVDVHLAGTDGVAYATLTRSQRVHVRSLKSDRYVAAFIGDDEVTLDTEGAVVCITTDGSTYVESLLEAGLVMLPAEPEMSYSGIIPKGTAVAKRGPSKRKSSSKRTRRPSAAEQRRASKEVAETLSDRPANPDTVTPVKTVPVSQTVASVTVPKGTNNTKKVTTTTLEERVSQTVIETLMGLGLVGASK